MKKILFSLLLAVSAFVLNAQIKVTYQNKVGISENSPVSKLAVFGPGNSYASAYIENINSTNSSRALHLYNSITTGTWGFYLLSHTNITTNSALYNVGIKGAAYASSFIDEKRSYGVYGVAGNARSGWNYGLYGKLYGTANGAAVFAATNSYGDCEVDGKYAGYFRGKVFVEDDLEYTDLVEVSDMALKKDVRPFRQTTADATDLLHSLSAIRYKLKTPLEMEFIGPEVTDTLSIDKLAATYDNKRYTDERIGLSAQEVQKVLPELVNEGDDGYLRMNYIGLIPVLLEAIKEQEAEIEALQSEIRQLQKIMIK